MNDQPLMLRLENLRAFFSMRWDHGRAQTVQDAINFVKNGPAAASAGDSGSSATPGA